MTNSMGVGNISSRVGAELASEHAVREARNDGPERHVTREDNIANHHLIRLSGPLERDNIVNGYGLRAVLWTQGCPNHCPGCQNPETWDFNGGMLVDIDEVKQRLREFQGQTGITFCGGEPFVQPESCKEIADWCRKELDWNVWSFSGFTYEQILEMGGASVEFLKSLDYLIDGPFILAERDLTMKFRGSKNQRLLRLEYGTGKILEIE